MKPTAKQRRAAQDRKAPPAQLSQQVLAARKPSAPPLDSTSGKNANATLRRRHAAHAPSTLIRAIQAGLPVQELEKLRASLDVSMEWLAPKLGFSKATLHRRKATGRLGPGESDRVVRYSRLMGKAAEVMESVENARAWLRAPQVGLGGAIPLEFAQTEVGAREVEDLLGRIEHGVYS